MPLSTVVPDVDGLSRRQTNALAERMVPVDSRRVLEQQVAQLATRLDHVDRQRLQELEEKESLSRRLQSLLDLLPAGVVVLDRHGIVSDCNPAAENFLGLPLKGERWFDVIQRSFAPRHDDGHEVSLKDGRRLSIETRSLDNGAGQVVLITDLTDTRDLQQQLARHERLTLMGRMLAALAHQIRTPLAAAMLYVGHLSTRDLDTVQTRKFAGKAMSRLAAMEQQVRDMLTFVRGDVQLADRISAQSLLATLGNSLDSPPYDERCELTDELIDDTDVFVQCNEEVLVGAIMNLVNNAIQASEPDSLVSVQLRIANDHLELCVSDRGEGMNEEVLSRINDAFYTTKSHGTGLGLAVARAVVRAHHGEMHIESERGEGTKVTLVLPVDCREVKFEAHK